MSLVSSVRRLGLGFALAGLVSLAAFSLPAIAQDTTSSASSEAPAVTEVAAVDPAAAERGFKVWRGSDCAGCHGWAGNGEKIGENPKGPNLRELSYDAAILKEVVLCGRPGTLMPSHDPKAYDDDRCYGMVAADLGNTKPPKGKPMTPEQADDIAAFIIQDIQGKPTKPSLEECQRYYGKKPLCNMYAE
jgi:mono/diheme cytochrome c family protein